MKRARPRDLFQLFFRIGLFTFGGGMAMIPLIQRDLCARLCLVDDEAFIRSVALAQCAPGPIAGNLAVLLGYEVGGLAGAAAALIGVALPAFLVILLIAWQYHFWRDISWAGRIFAGLRPAVVVLVAYAALRFGRMVLRGRVPVVIYLAALLALAVFRVHPALVVGGAGLAALVRDRVEQADQRLRGHGDVSTD